MALVRKNRGYAARLKFPLMCVTIFAMVSISTRIFSQSTPPANPPPPPPPPGELLKKINPFKKHKDTLNKKDTSKTKQAQADRPAGGPPPPPNPLDLFKKKKKDTTKKSAPPGTGN
ncbi:MAG TPA: hypothetical protein VFE53_02065 [Mucilaginibacter sp.]|jgi:hypothetical protein|nr:hypothetical protein [Mucilaginibacter sp.]